ncbi:MAG: dipeptidase, partial [Vicinamibacterales bacterium]
VAQGPRTEQGYAAARRTAQQKFDGIFRMTRTHPDRIMLACRPSAVETLQEGNRHAAMIGVENGYAIGRDISLLRDYYDQCARYFGLVHNGHNDIADSATPNEGLGDAPEEHGGLSAFGEQVVRELNRLGIMVDVSHSSKKAMLHAIRVSRAPIIASHSGAAAVNQHRRNLDDEQLLALRDNGGVVQAVALADFVKSPPTEKTEAIAALRTEYRLAPGASLDTLSADERARYDEQRAAIESRWPRANVSDFVDHIDHIVEVAGIDHVGIASDFDGGGGIDGWSDASETFNVTLELVRRGYSEEQIAKIWGGNLLRVWREVESIGEGARPSQ